METLTHTATMEHTMTESTKNSDYFNDDTGKTSKKGEINDGFLSRRDNMIKEINRREGHTFHDDKSAKICIKATTGRNISEWEFETETVIEPGGWATFSVNDTEYRIKLFGVEMWESYSGNSTDVTCLRVAIDRFENGKWSEFVEKGGRHHQDFKNNVTCDLEFIGFE